MSLAPCPRERKESLEQLRLSPHAMQASQSRGRRHAEAPCPVRTAYERDLGRILYSLPFRRLRHKTQVFFNPQNDHVCTRMEHVFYVAYLAETIGSSLGLNTDLIRAVAMGHDIGHTPFGHSGETVLNEMIRRYGGDFVFRHELHSLRVIDCLATHRGEPGLNLTFEVRDGIASHCGERYGEHVLRPRRDKTEADLIPGAARHDMPATLEGCVVRVADRIAYVGRDIEDAARSGLLSFTEVPRELRDLLGRDNSEIVDTLVRDVIEQSAGRDEIRLSEAVGEALTDLIALNVERIYRAERVRRYEIEAENIIKGLFEYFYERLAGEDDGVRDPEAHLHRAIDAAFDDFVRKHPEPDATPLRLVIDYIAGMTDTYASRTFSAIYQI